MKQLLTRILIMLSIGSYCLADLHSDFQQAYTLNKQGNIEQACQLYRTIVKQHEWCTQAIYNLAHTLKDLSLMTEAIDAYTIVINREPTNSFAHLGLSQCFLSLG
ncbi:MAG: tetratricopeptide repeat protein, partial [Candidatus Babeliales bacterium]|nr:tetratricopeptide repeat protein [Candidatus Babeliales bacterium]